MGLCDGHDVTFVQEGKQYHAANYFFQNVIIFTFNLRSLIRDLIIYIKEVKMIRLSLIFNGIIACSKY